jgi:hypothetical protein
MANTPPLSKGDKSNFATLQRAQNNGDLALMSAIRRVDRKPVALVCSVGRDGPTFAFTPVAVMIEGNPFDDFEPSRTDDPPAPVDEPFSPYAPFTVRPYEGKKWLVHGPTLPELGWLAPSESEAKSRAAMLRDAWCGGARWMASRGDHR